MALKLHADADVVSARAWVEAMLGLEVWAHRVYKQARGEDSRHT
jgi:hypothetical protein